MLVSQASFSPCSLFPLLSHHRSQLQEHENSHKFNFLVLCVSLTTQKHKVVIHRDKLSCHSYIKETKTFFLPCQEYMPQHYLAQINS